MMIPIPRRGIYHGVEGLAAAQSVPGVTGVTITAEPGQIVAPPPDGASYLGSSSPGHRSPRMRKRRCAAPIAVCTSISAPSIRRWRRLPLYNNPMGERI